MKSLDQFVLLALWQHRRNNEPSTRTVSSGCPWTYFIIFYISVIDTVNSELHSRHSGLMCWHWCMVFDQFEYLGIDGEIWFNICVLLSASEEALD
ncbi:hypothetical protein ACET3Z_032790 [Daucus carota]